MFKRYFTVILLVIALGLAYTIVTLADITDPVTTDPAVTDPTAPPAPATPTPKDQNWADAINEVYGTAVTAQEVADMHASGYGYGEISKAFGMAAMSGKAVSEITAMRAADMGWGEIAKSLGFKVSDVTKKQRAVKNSANEKNNKDKNKGNSDGDKGGKGKGHGKGGGHGK